MTPLLTLLLAGQAAVSVAAPAVTASLSLDRVTVELASRDRLRVDLAAAPFDGKGLAPVRSQRLLLADIPVPVQGEPQPEFGNARTRIAFEVDLRAVPESVLGIPFELVPVRWEGRDASGNLVLTVAGEIDPNDRNRLVVPAEELAKTYARLDDARVVPGLAEVAFQGLLRLYNPFGFELVVTRFDYAVKVGDTPVMRGVRPGFRLRPGVTSDVLLEQSASLADVAAGVVGALVGGQKVAVDGTVVLRAPTGEQAVPIRLVGAVR